MSARACGSLPSTPARPPVRAGMEPSTVASAPGTTGSGPTGRPGSSSETLSAGHSPAGHAGEGRGRSGRQSEGSRSKRAGGAVREISVGQTGDNRGRMQSPEGEGPTQRGGGGDDCSTRTRMVGFERGQRVRGHPGRAGWAAQGRRSGRLWEVGRQKQVHGARHCRKQELRAGKAGGSRARRGRSRGRGRRGGKDHRMAEKRRGGQGTPMQ